MKRKLLILLATVSMIGFSCKKIDFPLPKKLCQIKQIIRNGGPVLSGTFDYEYNNERLLTNLTFTFGAQEILTFEYDNHDRPIIIHGIAETDHLFYQNNLLVRVDRFDFNNQLLEQVFLTYDNRKRLIERKGNVMGFVLTRYEYEGHSKNPKRKLLYRPSSTAAVNSGLDNVVNQLNGQELQLQIIYEYEYDNKINPQATLIGQPVSPFYFGQEFPLDRFEPIPENNIVHQKFLTLSGGAFIKYMEYLVSYEYENNYPVKENHRKLSYNPDPSIPPRENFAEATYAYECKN